MSYPTGPSAPEGPGQVRPGTVTVASYLLYAVAGLLLISVILALAYVGDMQKVFEDAFANVDGGDTVASFTTVATVVTAIVELLVGIGLVILAFFNNKGKNPARIVTWVVGGVFLCCCGANLATTAAGGTFATGGQSDPDMPTSDELQDMLADVLPSWYNAVTIVLALLTLLALLGALILLALPPSNEFFRKRPAEWQPPVPGQPGYLAYPAYPPATPPAAGQPAPPPAAGQPAPPPAAGQPPAAGEPPAGGPPPAGPTPPGEQPRGDA